MHKHIIFNSMWRNVACFSEEEGPGTGSSPRLCSTVLTSVGGQQIWNFLTMAIMNLGLSSKELGQLHLHPRNCKACFCVRNEIWYHIFMLSTPCSVGEHELYEILFSFHYNLDFGWSVNSCVLSRGKIKTSKLPNLSPTLDTAGHQQLEIGIVLSFPATWKNNNNVDKHF